MRLNIAKLQVFPANIYFPEGCYNETIINENTQFIPRLNWDLSKTKPRLKDQLWTDQGLIQD